MGGGAQVNGAAEVLKLVTARPIEAVGTKIMLGLGPHDFVRLAQFAAAGGLERRVRLYQLFLTEIVDDVYVHKEWTA